MKKFEEEVKRPTTTSLRPLTYRDNILKELSNIVKANYTKNAQILREHKEYINFLESRLKECEDLRIGANNEAAKEYALKCEVVEERAELKRENQRLRAENLAVKTLVEDAKKQRPEIPEVPQFVADWLDRKPLYAINGSIPVEIIEWSKKQTGYADLGMNINHLLKLKVNGYTVETPKVIVSPCPVCGFEDVEANFCGICGHKNEYVAVD